jgi:hypothetical protein
VPIENLREKGVLMELTIAHWLYAIVTCVVIITMIFRKGVVLPTLLGTLLIATVFKGSIVGGFTSVFNANLVAAKELFSIFLIITFMFALLHALKDIGSDRLMIEPIQKVMKNGHVGFLVLIVSTFIISLFFWPTPAVPLICALLVPAAVRAGLPIMAAAMAVAIAGQGMALSSDYVMQIAPMLSAKAAGLDTSAVADKAIVLSLITGAVAIVGAYLMYMKKMRRKDDPAIEVELQALGGIGTSSNEEKEGTPTKNIWTKIFALLVPLSMLAVMIYMVSTKVSSGRMGGFEGGDGAAFIGGVAILLLALATMSYKKASAFDL